MTNRITQVKPHIRLVICPFWGREWRASQGVYHASGATPEHAYQGLKRWMDKCKRSGK